MRATSGKRLQSVRRNNQRNVLVLVGPTASGKTALALVLARRLGGEIISADSRQIYKRLDIGTAKPSPEELASVRHYFVDEVELRREFNAGKFGKRGREIIDDILERGKLPVVVGGSGLYIRALIDGFFEGPASDPDLRAELYRRAHAEGNETLLRELERIDPEAARGMLPTNIRRIVRALEVFRITGSTISELQKTAVPINFVPTVFGLRWDRTVLYRRINERVDRMIENGFVEEVKELRKHGYAGTLNSLQTVGYKEAFDYLEGKTTIDEMVELIKRNSRRFAKRQLTWFRRDERIFWVDVANEPEYRKIAERIEKKFLSISAGTG